MKRRGPTETVSTVGAICRTAIAMCMLSFSIGTSFADSYVPPAGAPVETISITSSSNSVARTLRDTGHGHWFMATIPRGEPCTVWTSGITGGSLTGIKVYEIATSKTGSAADSARFTATTDQDGNLRITMHATNWSSSDDLSYKFYFYVNGSSNTKFTLNYQLAEVEEVLIGSQARPYSFNFLSSTEPAIRYGTETNSILSKGPSSGHYYLVSNLTKDKRYYFGVSTNVPSQTIFSVLDPDGVAIDISSLKHYSPWDSFSTNIIEHATCFTNSEEHVVIQTKSVVISNYVSSVTNETIVSSVTTNDLGGVTVTQTNFVSIVTVVTNVPSGSLVPQTMMEVSTNCETLVWSVVTNRVFETNITHVGACRDAWRFIPSSTGPYTFVFSGDQGAQFALHHAVMAASPFDGEISFSEPNGTFIPADGFLSVRLSAVPSQTSPEIYYTLNGSDPRYGGLLYESALKISSSTRIKAVAFLDDGDYGDVYSVDYYLERGVIGDALGMSGMDASLCDNATNWFVDVESTPEGGVTVRHVSIEDDAHVDLDMTLRGTGMFSFRWRTSSENWWDEGVFCTNGVEVARISGDSSWEDGKVSIYVVGTNELKWTYSKNEECSRGADCLWLADFEFDQTPAGSRELPYRFDFVEAERLPAGVYGRQNCTMTNGQFYMVANLQADRRYYLGVGTGTVDVVLSSVVSPDGGQVSLGSFEKYPPWIYGSTDVFDTSGCSDDSCAGICNDAWRFVPSTSGDYIFVFAGEGEFVVCDAMMPAIVAGDDIEFSIPDGTVIDSGKSLKVRINCLKELSRTNIYYSLDAADPRIAGGKYDSPLKISDTTIVKACVSHDDSTFGDVQFARYYASASCEQIVDAMGLSDASVSIGGEAVGWYVDVEKSPEGKNAIRNKKISDGEVVTLSLSLVGKGVFGFNWKVSSEKGFDEGIFYTNDVEVARISGETDWRSERIEIPVSGAIQLKWCYSKDEDGSQGEDCLWVSGFAFDEKVTLYSVSDSVDVDRGWFVDNGLADVATAMTMLDLKQIEELPAAIVTATNALPRSLYDSYLCGLNPTNELDQFSLHIQMQAGTPVLMWTPDLGTMRKYTIFGAAVLAEPNWHSPTNSADRFFRVEVDMP